MYFWKTAMHVSKWDADDWRGEWVSRSNTLPRDTKNPNVIRNSHHSFPLLMCGTCLLILPPDHGSLTLDTTTYHHFEFLPIAHCGIQSHMNPIYCKWLIWVHYSQFVLSIPSVQHSLVFVLRYCLDMTQTHSLRRAPYTHAHAQECTHSHRQAQRHARAHTQTLHTQSTQAMQIVTLQR